MREKNIYQDQKTNRKTTHHMDGNIMDGINAVPLRKGQHCVCVCLCLCVCVCVSVFVFQYVGQTKNSVKKRFQAHFYQIAHEPQKTEVSRHFNQRDHHKLADVEISVLSFVHQGPDSEAALQMRLRLEFDWIHKLRSQIPLGLNSIDSMY